MCSLLRSECSNLKLTEATRGRGPGIVKRTGRDEPMWVAIHTCMVAMLGISLYICLYLKLKKCYAFLIILFFSSTKSENKRAEQVVPRSGGWGLAQTMYTHVSK
jgi:hypothetical protein